jgi:hypothetical protein
MLFASTIPWLLLGVGALLGVSAGLIQLRALRESMSSLLAAESAMGVRRALSGSRYGRMYLYGLWGSTISMLVLAFAVNQGGGLLGWVAGSLGRWRLYIQGGAGGNYLAWQFRARSCIKGHHMTVWPNTSLERTRGG